MTKHVQLQLSHKDNSQSANQAIGVKTGDVNMPDRDHVVRWLAVLKLSLVYVKFIKSQKAKMK